LPPRAIFAGVNRSASSFRSNHVHFWAPEDVEPGAVDSWDPDAEPARYANGFGHSFLELYARLSRLGLPVSLGRDCPPHTRTLVSLGSIFDWATGSLDTDSSLQFLTDVPHGAQVGCIRSDIPVSFSLPVAASFEIIPTTQSPARWPAIWLPLLPQRGLIQRSLQRRGTLSSVGTMANRRNVPPQFLEKHFEIRLGELGLKWIPRIQDSVTPDARWHDFSDLDVCLCVRNTQFVHRDVHKPATKLINAWVAGCIPLIDKEAGYLELATPGHDCLVVDSPEAVIDTLASLVASPEMIAALERGVAEAARRYAPQTVLDQWQQLLFESDSVWQLPNERTTRVERLTLQARLHARRLRR